jgi:ABC-type glycerol-3-phosphate transport system substrate-binding protein
MNHKINKILLMCIIVLFMFSSILYAQENEELTEIVYAAPTGCTDWQTVRMWFEAFNKLHPNIIIKDAGYPRDGYEERLLTQFAANSPEVDFFTEWASTEEFMERDLLVPLDGSYDPDIKIDDILYQDIFPGLTSLFSYPQFSTDGDISRLYMIPINSSDAMVYIYREDLIAEAGLPGPPKTWEERIAYGQKLTVDKDGDGVIDVYGDVYQGSQKVMSGKEIVQTFVNALWTAGGEYLDENGLPAFNSEIGVKALQYIVDLRFKYKTIPPGVSDYTFAEVRDMLASGKAAMGENWIGYWKWMDTDPSSLVKGKVMIAPIPYLTKPSGYTHGGGLGIPKASQHKKEAWEFIKFMMLEPVQTIFHWTGLDITSRSSVANSEYVLSQMDPRTKRAMEIYAEITSNAKPLPLYKGSTKVIRALGDYLDLAMNQEMSPEDALNAAAKEATDIILSERK